MLRLAQEREQLTVIDDQFCAPTGADLLADITAYAILHLAHQPQAAGLYHLAAAGETSWNGYARHVLAHAKRLKPQLNIKVTEVKAVPSSAYQTVEAQAQHQGNCQGRAQQCICDRCGAPA